MKPVMIPFSRAFLPVRILISGMMFIMILLSAQAGFANRIYPIVACLNVREKPDISGLKLDTLVRGTWAEVVGHSGKWTRVKLDSGKSGYVYTSMTRDLWIKIHKKERSLSLVKDANVVDTYKIALGFDAKNDKVKQGDGCTPLGRFYLCEMLEHPVPKNRYGARSMRLSYPNEEDARRGLADKLISYPEYLDIVKSIRFSRMPPQNTRLGGSIRIHGGGTGNDWTLGCIAMANKDIEKLYDRLPPQNAIVEVYADKNQDHKINQDGFVNAMILAGAKSILKTGCQYTSAATRDIDIKYPMGDFNPQIGVCSDVVIRSLRYPGIDLQALLHEDIVLEPQRYPNIHHADKTIDHRRTRNLKIWLDRYARTLPNRFAGPNDPTWKPGDIVIMDTGVENGTIYDHIGIVSDRKKEGRLLVINLWTVGYSIAEMDLLNGNYPAIVGHYRLKHAFDYGAPLNDLDGI